MKRDPYAHIRAAIKRRLGGIVFKPLPPILRARQIVLAKHRRAVMLHPIQSL